MHPLLLEILPQIQKGYCCSQLLMQIFLQSIGEDCVEHANIIRSMHGLCIGMGGQEGPCGLMTSGVCILSLVAGRGLDNEIINNNLMPIVQEYYSWFIENTHSSGTCINILTKFQSLQQEKIHSQNGHSLCGDLLATCWDQICNLVEKYNLDFELKNNI